MQKEAFFKLTYGLFALFTNDGERDNACIINTACQITDSPKTLSICVNKANYSCETLLKSKKFTLSVLSESAPFEIFKRFGFASGRDSDKLAGFEAVTASENGISRLTAYSNAYFCADVIETVDMGTHVIFIASVTEAEVISDEASMTYAYYFANVKPSTAQSTSAGGEKKIVGWVCKICGYKYEGADIPADFLCPWCKHPVEDFEPIYE